MESDAGAEKYHRYHEPDPEMHEMGYRGYGTPEKPIYATHAPTARTLGAKSVWQECWRQPMEHRVKS